MIASSHLRPRKGASSRGSFSSKADKTRSWRSAWPRVRCVVSPESRRFLQRSSRSPARSHRGCEKTRATQRPRRAARHRAPDPELAPQQTGRPGPRARNPSATRPTGGTGDFADTWEYDVLDEGPAAGSTKPARWSSSPRWSMSTLERALDTAGVRVTFDSNAQSRQWCGLPLTSQR